jgi:hypothetical protein
MHEIKAQSTSPKDYKTQGIQAVKMRQEGKSPLRMPVSNR